MINAVKHFPEMGRPKIEKSLTVLRGIEICIEGMQFFPQRRKKTVSNTL